MQNKYTTAVDLWAVGCTLFEMITLKKKSFALAVAMQSKVFFNEFDRLCSERYPEPYCTLFKEILHKLLESEPEKRPTAKQVVQVIEDLQSLIEKSTEDNSFPTKYFPSNLNLKLEHSRKQRKVKWMEQ